MEQNIYNAIYKVNHAGGCGSCFYQDNDKNSCLARVGMVNFVLDIALL